ncbi:MAG: hypothetical protein QN178_17475, partial [Armatimonadota bacterium]|nr:hypothetical protein [Armatimonadota bacterium]
MITVRVSPLSSAARPLGRPAAEDEADRMRIETDCALRRTCRYLRRNDRRASPLPVILDGREVSEPLHLDGPCSLSFSEGSVEGVVALGRVPHVELYARGLPAWHGTILDELRHDTARIDGPRHPEGLAPVFLLNGNSLSVFNPLLCEERRRKREALLAATEKELARLAREVARRRRKPLSKEEIGVKVGKVIDRYKMGKHFAWSMEEGSFRYERRQDSIERELQLDGIYVIRTSEPAERLSASEAVRAYRQISKVEQLFRTIKGIDRLVRPIRHRA